MSSTHSEEENDANGQNERKMERNVQNATTKSKILREAMRDVVISVFLLVLTTIVTQGDFQKSPTASLLVSGT